MDVLHSSHHYRCKDDATHSLPRNFLLCLIQKYMNKTRHGDIWTSVHTRQTQSNNPTNVCFRAHWSTREMSVLHTTTHITDLCVCETWMSVQSVLNRCCIRTYLLLNPVLPVFFVESSSLLHWMSHQWHHTPSFLLLHLFSGGKVPRYFELMTLLFLKFLEFILNLS